MDNQNATGWTRKRKCYLSLDTQTETKSILLKATLRDSIRLLSMVIERWELWGGAAIPPGYDVSLSSCVIIVHLIRMTQLPLQICGKRQLLELVLAWCVVSHWWGFCWLISRSVDYCVLVCPGFSYQTSPETFAPCDVCIRFPLYMGWDWISSCVFVCGFKFERDLRQSHSVSKYWTTASERRQRKMRTDKLKTHFWWYETKYIYIEILDT